MAGPHFCFGGWKGCGRKEMLESISMLRGLNIISTSMALSCPQVPGSLRYSPFVCEGCGNGRRSTGSICGFTVASSRTLKNEAIILPPEVEF